MVAAQTPDETCQALMTVPADTSDSAPTAHIAIPDDGATIYGSDVVVQVTTDNFEIGSGNHWHVWVDGQLQGMVFEPETRLTLQAGTHTICALLGDSQHRDLGMPDGITVTVAQAAAGTPTSAPAIADVSAPQPEAQRSPLTIVGVIVVGALVAVGGWWLGKRLPKGR